MLQRRCRNGHPHVVHIGVKVGDKRGAFRRNFVDKAVVADVAPPVHFVLPEGAGANRQTGPGSDPRTGPGDQVRGPQGQRARSPDEAQ